MSDPLGASPLDSLTPASLTFPPPRTGAGMEMEMTMGARRGNRKGREAMVERRHGGVGPLEEMWHPKQLTCDGCGWEVPCCWHAPGARRTSSLALYACRQHSLHGWPLVCAFRRGREERQFLSALCFSFFSGGEEAARQYTAITMILKSHAHTATREFRCRGCYGSNSFTKLHDAQMTVHT